MLNDNRLPDHGGGPGYSGQMEEEYWQEAEGVLEVFLTMSSLELESKFGEEIASRLSEEQRKLETEREGKEATLPLGWRLKYSSEEVSSS